MSKEEYESFCPSSKKDWRNWLKKHHDKKQCIWLVLYKKNAPQKSISWSDAVDEALCFGWIDSTRKSIDQDSFRQYFSRRKANSNWSKINKEKVDQLIAKKQMMPAGLECINIAKQNGSWTILDSVEAGIIPADLKAAFKAKPNAKKFYNSLSKSIQKQLLYRISSAKRPETRSKRIEEIVSNANNQELPKALR